MISMIYESMELWVPKELTYTNSWRNRCIMAQGLISVFSLSLLFSDEREPASLHNVSSSLLYVLVLRILSAFEYSCM